MCKNKNKKNRTGILCAWLCSKRQIYYYYILVNVFNRFGRVRKKAYDFCLRRKHFIEGEAKLFCAVIFEEEDIF